MCLNNLAWRSSALCANMEIWQVDQSKDLAQIFTNPALCTCVPAVIKHPFSPLSPESLQQFVEGLRKWRPFWQALYSPPLYSQTQSGRLQRQKGSFSTWPLSKKNISFRKKKGHFQRSSVLSIAELCNLCSPANLKSCRVSLELHYINI